MAPKPINPDGQPSNPDVLEAALGYARRGWRVVPCYMPLDGGCSCREGKACEHPGKHPRTSHGFNDATTNEATIQGWFDQWPLTNISIRTGNGLAVLDVDPRHGGRDQLLNLCSRFGVLPPGPCVETGGGGLHLYYAVDADHRSRVIAPGVELKCAGSCVVAPPSLHISGLRYRWSAPPESVSLPELLPWLTTATTEPTVSISTDDAPIPKGARHSTLLRQAGALRRVGASQDAILAALTTENATRCVPPLPDSELRALTVSMLIYPPSRSGESGVSAQTHPPKGGVGAENQSLRFETAAQLFEGAPENVEFIVKPYVAAGTITVLNGKVKLGKTTFTFALVRCVLDGADFLGQPTIRTRVVLLTEQPRASLRASLARAGLQGREDISILRFSQTLATSWPCVVTAAIAECQRINARLLVIDTLTQFLAVHGIREDAADDALVALAPIQQGALDLGIGVLLNRHQGKKSAGVGDSGRGSSAYDGIADSVVSLCRPAGKTRPTVRVLGALSRFDEVPETLTIDRNLDGYVVVGTGTITNVVMAETEKAIMDSAPKFPTEAITSDELTTRAKAKRSTAQRVIKNLRTRGNLIRSGTGKRGDPFRYHATDCI